MSETVPRLRMFAGPNGSGKSTLKLILNPELLAIYINPDEIEKEIHKQGLLDLSAYKITTGAQEILGFFTESKLLKMAGFGGDAQSLGFDNDKLIFHGAGVNAYFASVAADFIRRKLLEKGKSFSCETVMSSPDKVELLHQAQKRGYRTYLYYVATEDPDINISRVRYRVKMGGHPVPEEKIPSRYVRSLDLLMPAVRFTHRAYIFDNSSHEQIWVAEIINGCSLEMKTDQMPIWFKKALWDKFEAAAL